MGRVALTEQLLRNANLQEGDEVDIYFDAATKRIILERAKPAPRTTSASRQMSPKGKA